MKSSTNIQMAQLPKNLKYAVQLAQEKGTLSWLSSLPTQEQGFILHKDAFKDTI